MKTKTKLLSIAILFLIGTSALWILPHQAKADTSGLVGYWKFDEGQGTVAHDSSGNGNDGTVYGATWTDGVSNGALEFDGTSNYVGIPSSPSLALTGNQVSLELWIKPSVTLDSSLNHRINIMDKGDNYGFQMEAGYGQISFYVNIPSASVPGDQWLPTTTNNWVAGTWYHIAGTYDGTTQKIYVNGILENSRSVSGSLSGIPDPLSIGSYCYGTMNFFPGAIDEVKIYNYARTADPVLTDYTEDTGTTQPTLIWMQWWLWSNIFLGIATVGFAFTAVYYRQKAISPKESKNIRSKPLSTAGKTCPSCGANLPAESKFCGKCGTPLE